MKNPTLNFGKGSIFSSPNTSRVDFVFFVNCFNLEKVLIFVVVVLFNLFLLLIEVCYFWYIIFGCRL